MPGPDDNIVGGHLVLLGGRAFFLLLAAVVSFERFD